MGACRSSAHRLRIARASGERLARPGRCGGGGGGENRSATRPASSRRVCLPNVQQAKAEQKVETSKSLVLSLYAAFVLVFFILHAHCWLLHGNAISPPVLCELGGAAHTALCISLSFDALRCLSLKRRIARFETEKKTATLPRVMCVDRLFCMAFFDCSGTSRSSALLGLRRHPPLPPQGEFKFVSKDVPRFDAAENARRRIHIAQPAAHDGDPVSSLTGISHTSSDLTHPILTLFMFRSPPFFVVVFWSDKRAQQTVGLLMYYGVGGAVKDERGSAFWHAAAAAQGNLDGVATLGGCVRRGVGAARDEQRGMSLSHDPFSPIFQTPSCLNITGCMSLEVQSLNLLTGLALICAAAAAGNPVGLVKLGVLLDEGELPGGKRPGDAMLSSECFAAAAAQGSALGLFNHGWALLNGVGIRRQPEAALQAWHRAARLSPDDGSEEAAFHIFNEQEEWSGALSKRARPDACLRLSGNPPYLPPPPPTPSSPPPTPLLPPPLPHPLPPP